MAGTIYCFNTVSDSLVYKAGHTQQGVATRLRGYVGPSKPRMLVCTRDVDDSATAESLMLSLLRVCSVLRPRLDLGNEWFEATEPARSEERHKAIGLIMNTVALAIGSAAERPPKRPKSSERDEEVPPPVTGMGRYFQAMDEFMQHASADELFDFTTAFDAFESSELCPVYADYVMWPRQTRMAVARNRYPQLC